jgi:hypothetical protein
MKTCGMMGEVVGKAASICYLNGCLPRGVYEEHLDELLELLTLPGKARRNTPSEVIVIPDDALPLAGPEGPPSGMDAAKLKGIVIDDKQAKLDGHWQSGTGLKNYVGYSYLYAGPTSRAKATFKLTAQEAGKYKVQIFSQSHENRSTKSPVTIIVGDQATSYQVNQRVKTADDVITIDELTLQAGEDVTVVIGTTGADGNVHVDAVRLLQAN